MVEVMIIALLLSSLMLEIIFTYQRRKSFLIDHSNRKAESSKSDSTRLAFEFIFREFGVGGVDFLFCTLSCIAKRRALASSISLLA
jgi:hypothetical protein